MHSPQNTKYRLLSHSFVDLISKFGDRITTKLGRLNEERYDVNFTRNITIINGEMSFCPSGKESFPSDTKNDKWLDTNRQIGKFGKTIKKVLKEQCPNWEYTNQDMEKFVNLIKGELIGGEFKIVSGKEIGEWYKQDKYESREGTLSGSCMQGKPEDYFSLYVENPEVVSMVILLKEDRGGELTNLVGRAIIWTVGDKKYMDRIYGSDHTISRFCEYAKENSITRKTHQSYQKKFEWTTPDGVEMIENLRIKMKTNVKGFPYLDTFSFMGAEFLTNDINDHEWTGVGLDTNGLYTDDRNYVICGLTGDRMHVEDAVYFLRGGYYPELCDVHVTRSLARCDDFSRRWILIEDAIQLNGGNYTHKDSTDIITCNGNDDILEHKNNTFVCDFDGKFYSTFRTERVPISKIQMVVAKDNVRAAYESKDWVQDIETKRWYSQGDMKIIIEKREEKKRLLEEKRKQAEAEKLRRLKAEQDRIKDEKEGVVKTTDDDIKVSIDKSKVSEWTVTGGEFFKEWLEAELKDNFEE